MDIDFMFDMSTHFLQSTEWACLIDFAQFFRGMILGVITWSNSPVGQLEACLICLQATQIEMAC